MIVCSSGRRPKACIGGNSEQKFVKSQTWCVCEDTFPGSTLRGLKMLGSAADIYERSVNVECFESSGRHSQIQADRLACPRHMSVERIIEVSMQIPYLLCCFRHNFRCE